MDKKPLKEVAEDLVKAHVEEDPDTTRIYLIPDLDEDEIRLVELTESISPRHEVLPFKFAAHPDFPYKVTIVLLNPTEWKEVENGSLRFPEPWGAPKDFEVLYERENNG